MRKGCNPEAPRITARKETEWDVTNVDPDYHFKAIVDALKLAKDQGLS